MGRAENSRVPPVQYTRTFVRIVGLVLLIEQLLIGLPSTHTLACTKNAPSESGAITGKVDLQGRTDEQGAIVFISPGGTGGYLSVSDSSGNYTISNVPPGTYDVSIEMTLYLGASKSDVVVSAGETTTLSPVRLLGGDCNDDDIVSTLDATIIGATFGSAPGDANWDPLADVNDDGKVNILDAALLGQNWNKSSPVPWPWGTICFP